MLKHGSLFSGIGGFDIAATWMGWQNVFSCEKDPFCRSVLGHYWPNTTHYEDIYDFNAAQFRGQLDIISGGFPCQPFSQAGRRMGSQDDRYLFPETIRIIKEARPEWIVLENVTGLFTILQPDSLSEVEIQAVELFCQDGEQPATSTILRLQQRVIGSIISEIGAAGYILPTLEDGTPVILCIPAAAIGAPHRRDRVWFVAHANSDRDQQPPHDGQAGTRRPDTERPQEGERQRWAGIADGLYGLPYLTGHSHGQTAAKSGNAAPDPAAAAGDTADGRAAPWHQVPRWTGWPTESPFCGRNDGLPKKLDGITFSTWRTESIKAYGNAIVPQVALEIFRAIQQVTLNRQTA